MINSSGRTRLRILIAHSRTSCPYVAIVQQRRSAFSLRVSGFRKCKLEKYRGFGRFDDWMPLNIEGMAKRIRLHRRGN